jgi:hypothetical protein
VILVKNSFENGLAEFVGMKHVVDYTSRKCFASVRVAVPRLKRLSYAIHSHSFSGLVIQITIESFSLGARHLFQKLVCFFLCEVTLVIHCCCQNKNLSLSEFLKKSMCSHLIHFF